MDNVVIYDAPKAYDSWTNFFNNAPGGTVFQFMNESHTWTAIGGGAWKSSGTGFVAQSSHLCRYAPRGVIIFGIPTDPWSPSGDEQTLDLIALQKFVNQKIEEAYERGKKDGYSAGYNEGWDDCEHQHR
jgi:hypothetical protein